MKRAAGFFKPHVPHFSLFYCFNVSVLEQSPGRLRVPAAHLAQAGTTRGCPFICSDWNHALAPHHTQGAPNHPRSWPCEAGFGFFFFPFFFGADVLAEAGKRRVQCGEQSSRAARPRAVNYGFNFSLYGLLLTADQ